MRRRIKYNKAKSGEVESRRSFFGIANVKDSIKDDFAGQAKKEGLYQGDLFEKMWLLYKRRRRK